MQLFRTLLFLLQFFYVISSDPSINFFICSGHDGCKNKEWIGSYDVTCNGGERICHNTILKCGRQNCKITVKGSGHDAYQNSIVYAQNIKSGNKFELICQSTGQRKCKNNIIYCPREVGTECQCSNCDSSTIMYYKYGTKVSTGGATARRYLDSPIMCDGKAQCNIDERIQQNDYTTIPSYNSYLSSYVYRYLKLDNSIITFKDTIGEEYLTYRYIYKPNQNPSYEYEIQNYSAAYGYYPIICRKRRYDDYTKYFYYRPHCNKYYYGDPYEGFWVLGEPAQSCINACIDYNMTSDKEKHKEHLPELKTEKEYSKILRRFNLTCDSYWVNGKWHQFIML